MTTAPRSASIRETVDLPDPMPPVSPTTTMAGGPYHRRVDTDLFSPQPDVRLAAARSLGRFARRAALRRGGGWAPGASGAAHAWRLLVAPQPTRGRDPLFVLRGGPAAAGEA